MTSSNRDMVLGLITILESALASVDSTALPHPYEEDRWYSPDEEIRLQANILAIDAATKLLPLLKEHFQ